MKSSSNINPQLVECTNKDKDIWVIRWDVKQVTDKDNNVSYEYQEERFTHLPTYDEIQDVINRYHNKVTDQKILSGFKWNGVPVWLSTENQFNYKATHDIAVQTNGATLPVTFKLGTDDEPSYVTFKTVQEIGAFYTAALAYIQSCYTDGWTIKDSFDYSGYMSVINRAKGSVQ